MEYINIKRQGDEEVVAHYKASFEKESLKELVEDYNKQARLGIVGVHQQALYLIALRKEFLERLKDSPVYLRRYILGMRGQINLINGKIKIQNHENN
jgi:hypothetical protein